MTTRLTPDREAEIRSHSRDQREDLATIYWRHSVAELLAELDAVRVERDEARRYYGPAGLRTVSSILDESDKLRAAAARAVEALEFYANKNRWEPTTNESTLDGIGCTDFSYVKLGPGEVVQMGGRTAREALPELRKAIGVEGS